MMFKRIANNQSIHLMVLRILIVCICMGLCGACESCDNKLNKKETGGSPSANAALTMVIAYDPATKEVKATITNAGKKKLEADQAKLTWDTGHNGVTIGGNKASVNPVNVPDIPVGGNIDINLGKVAFNVSGTLTTMTVTLQWDQLPSDVVGIMALTENQHVIIAATAKSAVDLLEAEVDTEITSKNLVKAKAAYDKIGLEVAKIVAAQTAVGGPGKVQPIDDALTAVRQAEQAAKAKYDAEINAQTLIATTAKGEVDRLKVEVDNQIKATNVVQAKDAYDKIAGEIQKIKDVQTAVGGPGVQKIDDALTAAELEAGKAKTAYDNAIAANKPIAITDKMIAAAKNYKNYNRTPFLEEVLEKLKNNQPVDINATDPYGVNGNPPSGQTALHRAMDVGDVDIVKALLARKPDVNQADNSSYTPLHKAAVKGNTEIFRLLLGQPLVNINRPGDYRQTPLHLASEWGHVDLVELLLDCPGIQVELEDDGGQTPLMLAGGMGVPQSSKLAIQKLLKDEGATK